MAATKRNGLAKSLENPAYRQKIVKSKKRYSRKEKHRGKENHSAA